MSDRGARLAASERSPPARGLRVVIALHTFTSAWGTRQRLRTRELRIIYRDILLNLQQMDVQRSIRPGNNQV